jgi:hypothetical protein
MIYLFLSLIILAFPFLLLSFFNDKKAGFAYILFFWVLFQTATAVITQFFGIFYFWVILGINLSAVLLIIFYIIKKQQIKKIFDLDWMLIFVIAVSLLYLHQVHYNYTGKISLSTDQSAPSHHAKSMTYQYPYYSDEWDAVVLMNYSIDTHLLPTKNPLNNSSYINFAIPYFSFLSALSLFLRTSPLLCFNFIAIFINILIIVISYFFLRINKTTKIVSAISALSLLYISCGANLPGIWHLLPIHLGIVFSLLGLCFMSLKEKKMAIASAIMVLLFYLPLILFYGLALAVFLAQKINIKNKKNQKIVFYAGAVATLAVLTGYFLYLASVLSQKYEIGDALFSRLFYPSFSGDFIPQYTFYYVIPFFILLFFVFGIYYVFKNMKWLFSQVILGAFFWALYSFITYRIVIDFERVVFFTSIIVVLISGFGLKEIFEYINSKYQKNIPAIKYAGFLALAVFVLVCPFYTAQSNWEKFILIKPADGAKAYPRSPANNYITKDDIKLFEGISQKRFLSIPWKGLVLAAATKNYPVVAKEGIISAGDAQMVDKFLKAECDEKIKMAKSQKIDYIYLYNLNCDGFEKKGQSREGFVLYKVL